MSFPKPLPSLLLLGTALPLGGCLAKAAVDVVTLPVKAVSAGVDAVTTSQKERDEKRGRALRRHEECLGREERKARKERREPDPARCPDPEDRSTSR